jgi:hypothetical protein
MTTHQETIAAVSYGIEHEGVGYMPEAREAITQLFMAQCDDGGYTFPCGYHPGVLPAPRKPEVM